MNTGSRQTHCHVSFRMLERLPQLWLSPTLLPPPHNLPLLGPSLSRCLLLRPTVSEADPSLNPGDTAFYRLRYTPSGCYPSASRFLFSRETVSLSKAEVTEALHNFVSPGPSTMLSKCLTIALNCMCIGCLLWLLIRHNPSDS